MGARVHELFGDPSRNVPATPDSYGVHPPGFRLPASTHLGGVTLQVSDLARSRHFYEQTLGFRFLSETPGRVALGAGDAAAPLVTLIERSHTSPPESRKTLGLFHIAMLLPTRSDLGRFLRHLQERGDRIGAGDHRVSEALYLQDPDDLGIEVYADRPRDTWLRRGKELVMGTDSLDMRNLVESGGDTTWNGMPAGATIGHVHLHVGDINTASRFYSDALGFDRIVWSYPGALFLGAGGYHHHLGTNTWAGPYARPAAEHEPQLLEWTLLMPTDADVRAAEVSVSAAGFTSETSSGDGSLVVRDPWGTALRLLAATP